MIGKWKRENDAELWGSTDREGCLVLAAATSLYTAVVRRSATSKLSAVFVSTPTPRIRATLGPVWSQYSSHVVRDMQVHPKSLAAVPHWHASLRLWPSLNATFVG